MLIKYKPKHDHIKCVPLIPVTDVQKKYKLDRSQVQLLPGTNEVTDEEWDVMKTHLSKEDLKIITVIEIPAVKGKKTEDGKAHSIKDVPPQKAVALVAECVNPDTLIKWHQEETREEIRLAIVERMKELKIEVPKYKPDGSIDDDDEDDDDKDTDSLDKMTLEQLKAYAAEKNITVSGNKAEILAAIKAAEEK
jgi:hypothetical protein